MRFPAVTGSNLQRQKLSLPQDFRGELNLVLIAFQQWQQTQVDTWLPFVRQLEENHSGVRYYELPTIQRRSVLSRTLINEGMRAGIPDPVARERTITLYVDKETFREAFSCPTRTISMCSSWTAVVRLYGEQREPSHRRRVTP
jgi:hypothetical protein